MLLRRKLAEMTVTIDPALYWVYVTYSATGVPVLYVRLSKDLYGMLTGINLRGPWAKTRRKKIKKKP